MANVNSMQSHPAMPREMRFDSTFAMMRDPYGYIQKQCRDFGEDVFETRLMLRKTICMTGPEAAQLFYDRQYFQRKGAAPMRLQATLFGRGGVQTLDGPMHQRRKQMFMSLMTPDRIRDLGDLVEHWLQAYVQKWESSARIDLYRDAREILCRAVCEWSGVPLPESKVATRTRQLSALFESAGAIGPKHWWGRMSRLWAHVWAGHLIHQIRTGKVAVPRHTAAYVIAHHRDADGKLLTLRTAAVELLNVLRPTVALGVYIVFIAHALHEHPDSLQKLAEDETGRYAEWFVQEVRRFYPFFPSAVAKVRQDFTWKGYDFPKGRRVILDLHGTNHDPRVWTEPNAFRPERFTTWNGNPFSLIAQGGGDHFAGHRCAGEWITIELMQRVARFLARQVHYRVPTQELDIDMQRLPALPKSRLVIEGVRPG